MNRQKLITGNNEDEIWEQLTKDLATSDELLEYNATIQQENRHVILNIDIDLGGGFESGYETTTFVAPLNTDEDFKFAIHKQDFLDEVGKFFGMQDVAIGDEEFDRNVIVKTNNEARVKKVFADANAREVFQTLASNFTLAITRHDGQKVLELSMEQGITDPMLLRRIYNAFYTVLLTIETEKASAP